MKHEIIPLKGFGEITFGMTPDEVSSVLGNPDYYENIEDEDDDTPILYYEYEDLGVSIYFEQEGGKNVLSYFETDNDEITLYGTKVFALTSSQLIELMKHNGAELTDREDEDGATRFSFDSVMMDFFFEGEEMTVISWSAD